MDDCKDTRWELRTSSIGDYWWIQRGRIRLTVMYSIDKKVWSASCPPFFELIKLEGKTAEAAKAEAVMILGDSSTIFFAHIHILIECAQMEASLPSPSR